MAIKTYIYINCIIKYVHNSSLNGKDFSVIPFLKSKANNTKHKMCNICRIIKNKIFIRSLETQHFA